MAGNLRSICLGNQSISPVAPTHNSYEQQFHDAVAPPTQYFRVSFRAGYNQSRGREFFRQWLHTHLYSIEQSLQIPQDIHLRDTRYGVLVLEVLFLTREWCGESAGPMNAGQKWSLICISLGQKEIRLFMDPLALALSPHHLHSKSLGSVRVVDC